MISIITPVYNTEKYIEEYINSVLNQSYNDFELVLVDDNSIDSSLEICNKAAYNDHRIRVIHLENNMGASHARNVGLKAAIGEYITFADSDDFLPQTALEKMFIEITNRKADIVFANLRVITPGGKSIIRKFPKGRRVFDKKEAISAYLNFWVLYGAVCGKLYKKECLENVLYPENMRFGEDGVFCTRAIANSSIISVIDDVVYEYRQRTNSTSNHGVFSVKELEDRILQKQYVQEAFNNCMSSKDFIVFTFELYRVVKYWEKNYKSEISLYKSEYHILKDFCDKYWLTVFIHTYNIRIKVRALKYRLNMI